MACQVEYLDFRSRRRRLHQHHSDQT